MEQQISYKNYLYYILIGVVSFIMLVFLPMMGSVAGLEWTLPTTLVGWIVYVISKLSSAAFNVSIFHCFNKQGKLNISKNKDYLQAQELLQIAHENKEIYYRSPFQFSRDIYGKKGVTIFVTTLLGTIGLSQSILTFNLIEFIVQLISLIIGIIFGILQMKNTEEYWTVEYLGYAKNEQRKFLLEKEESKDVIQN